MTNREKAFGRKPRRITREYGEAIEKERAWGRGKKRDKEFEQMEKHIEEMLGRLAEHDGDRIREG